MKKRHIICLGLFVVSLLVISFTNGGQPAYTKRYFDDIAAFKLHQRILIETIAAADLNRPEDVARVRATLNIARNSMKGVDFWLRYLQPTDYKKINGPLPVEWETEVFEKFERPYKRVGAGLTLASLYLEEKQISKDALLRLIDTSLAATDVFTADSTTKYLGNYHHFFLCNRLFLLNLAAIYTTGFECPATGRIIPELKVLLSSVQGIYDSYNASFPATTLTSNYSQRYNEMIAFVNSQPDDYTQFDHYAFIRNYVNPLYALNQQMIKQYKVVSRNLIDYSLNKEATIIFDKKLYNGQNEEGLFIRVSDPEALAKIDAVGKQLFYDPILSGNNMRSCASCHRPKQYFTDTAIATATHFNQHDRLPRNSPSLVNVVYNHLLMLDGKHFTLQNQCKAVITNPDEMNCNEAQLLEKILSCNEYKTVFEELLKYTPQEKEITFDHIASAITTYYSKFSHYTAPVDDAMNGNSELTAAAKNGFNLFMSKAQCGTCHFVPQFNGVKPPYVGSEFEVLGIPSDTSFKKLSSDEGRYNMNSAPEMRNAFRTGSLRNIAHTQPYMHNGVFTTLEQVIDFYDVGGGIGKGLKIENQTLAADSLKLTRKEKQDLIAFLQALDENIVFDEPPIELPKSKNSLLNSRVVGGTY